MFGSRKLSVILAFVLVFAFGAVAFAQTSTPGAQMGTNSITVQDQAVANGTVMIQQVVAAQAGAVVIHADNNGAPGAIIGFAPVTAGTNSNVQVTIDQAQATNTLWAMLHSGDVAAGATAAQVEANNPPVMDASGKPVQQSFTVTGLQAAQATATATVAAEVTPAATETVAAATPAATETVAAAAVTPAATTAAAVTATRTASPATLPTTGGSNSNMLVVLLLGLGGLSLLAGLGLNLVRRSH